MTSMCVVLDLTSFAVRNYRNVLTLICAVTLVSLFVSFFLLRSSKNRTEACLLLLMLAGGAIVLTDVGFRSLHIWIRWPFEAVEVGSD